MNEAMVMGLTQQALIMVLVLSLPPIIVAAVLGIVVSFLQALTQLQEQTLPFAIKLIGVTLTIAAMGAWLGAEVLGFARKLFESFVIA
ncbi:MAG: type III secretion system export apparatus subunit SctS [Planctomycetaceae bacterium]|nr:type III secretion system export apparatus subunit SctS [Planctomycetaceae bacterium]